MRTKISCIFRESDRQSKCHLWAEMVLAPENWDHSWTKNMLHRHDNTLFTDTNINILQKIRALFYHSFPLWEQCICAKLLIFTRGGNHALFFPDFCFPSKFTLCQTKTFCTTSNNSQRGSNKREEEFRKQHLVCIPAVVLFIVRC